MTVNKKSQSHLAAFEGHCKLFYQKSLSSFDDDFLQNNDDSFEASRTVLDALEYHLVDLPNETISDEHRIFLSSEHAKTYSEHIEACGLELYPDSQKLHKSYDDLVVYSQIRDDQRRNAHEDHMKRRKLLLKSSIHDESWINCLENKEDELEKVSSSFFVDETSNLLKKFSAMYKGNVICHSFLAGLHYFIEKQKSDENVLLWTFHFSDGSNSYTYDTLQILRKIMIPSLDDIQLEQYTDFEVEYSFYIHPYISNKTLQKCLDVLPPRNQYLTKPSGNIQMKSPTMVRTNVSGEYDEKRGFMEWIGFCEIL